MCQLQSKEEERGMQFEEYMAKQNVGSFELHGKHTHSSSFQTEKAYLHSSCKEHWNTASCFCIRTSKYLIFKQIKRGRGIVHKP